ncbi:MAG: excinuclease ABC subunit UvrC [Alphaproteobacteria bacterium]
MKTRQQAPAAQDPEDDTQAEPGADHACAPDAAGGREENAGPSAPTGTEVIRQVVRTLPNAPGVYRMLDGEGNVLYVGKARELKKRVTSYTNLTGHTNRIARMILSTASMEIITTHTETEALLLEANLIKRLKPRFNVILRDDKSFPYILIDREHAVPRLTKHRGARTVRGDYFGPFASAGAVNHTLNTLQRAFLLRSCTDSVYESRTRPCLLHQIKRCSAPCTGEISEAGYDALVDDAVRFLKGQSSQVQDALASAMEQASEALAFERAAALRDRIRALSAIRAHQGINPDTVEEADVVGAHREGGKDGGQVCIQVFFIRSGQNWGNRAYYPRHDKDQTSEEILEAFLSQFYDDKPPPRQVLLSETIPGADLLQAALTIKAGHKVQVTTPRRAEKRALVEHAVTNAREALARRLAESASQQKLLNGVADAFGLDGPPRRIEVYDNSHIQGTNAVGGMIVAGPEGLMKSQYRKFNIKMDSLTPGDDYGMMRQVLRRRFERLLKESPRDGTSAGDDPEAETGEAVPWPDLVVIDGGPGQLSSALDVLADLGLETEVPLVAIAKGPERNAGRERFFMPSQAPFSLEPKSPVLYYLQRLRDEAHRFAIGTHRARRTKDIAKNPLDEIPGVGARRKKALLHRFGSAKGVSRAGLADLEAVDGINKALAERIYAFFRDTE